MKAKEEDNSKEKTDPFERFKEHAKNYHHVFLASEFKENRFENLVTSVFTFDDNFFVLTGIPKEYSQAAAKKEILLKTPASQKKKLMKEILDSYEKRPETICNLMGEMTIFSGRPSKKYDIFSILDEQL